MSDAGNVGATEALVQYVKDKYGRIDVLFSNAGIAKLADPKHVDESFFDSLFRINVRGPYFLVKYSLEVIPDGGAPSF